MRGVRVVVAVLSLLGLGLATAPPGRAATLAADTTYSCNPDSSEPLAVGATFSQDLPDGLRAGSTIAARSAVVTITLPESLVTELNYEQVRQVGGALSNLALNLGPTRIPLDGLQIPPTTVPASGTMLLTANGSSLSATAPRAGSYNLVVPLTMALRLTFSSAFFGVTEVDPGCWLAGPSTMGTVSVRAPSVSSRVMARQQGRRLLVRVTRSDGALATGTVAVTLGRRVWHSPLRRGRVAIGLPPVPHPTWVKVSYAGPLDVGLSSDRVRIR